MTKNKDLNYIAKLNTPKTETRIVLNDWQGEAKTSKLSASARNKVVNNGSYVSFRANITNPSYGPMPDDKHGCPREASFELTVCAGKGYYLGFEGGEWPAGPLITSGKLIDKEFGSIQKLLDNLKSGKVKVYKGTAGPYGERERTEECIQYEGWFQAQLENALANLKTANVYGYSMSYTFIKP